MVFLICEDCGSDNVSCRPDGIDPDTGEERYFLHCKDCFSEWYDIEEDIEAYDDMSDDVL